MSDDKEVKKEELLVAEQQDGSVTVEGMEDIPNENNDDAPQQKAEGGQVVPEDGGEDHPDDTDAIRAARREKRKAKKPTMALVVTRKNPELAEMTYRYGGMVR
jgi:hypothetical protein